MYWHVLPKGSLLFPAIDHMRQTIVAKTLDTSEGGVRTRAIVLDCSLVTRSDFSAAQVGLVLFGHFTFSFCSFHSNIELNVGRDPYNY